MSRVIHVDLGFTPRPWQREARQNRRRFNVEVLHRRGGKTVKGIIDLTDAAARNTRKFPAPRYAYICPVLKQSKVNVWKYVKHYAGRIPGTQFREDNLIATLPTGATIEVLGADDPDSIRGSYLDGVVPDEFAQMKPNVWGEILLPMLADFDGWATFIGTPKGINKFSELFHSALNSMSDPDSEWFAMRKTVYETGVFTPEQIETIRRNCTESQFAQEWLCDFAAAVENALIPLPIAREAANRVVTEAQIAAMPRILGVDVARYGDDRSVLFLRQGLVAFRPIAVRGLDTQELAGLVAAKCDELKPDAVFVDETGIGAGVIDRLKHGAVRCVGINFGSKPTDARYLNKRAEMWDAVRQWLEQGGSIPDDEALIADLCAPLYSHADANNRMKLEGKDEMRKRGLPSPDLGDALALTFAMPVLPRTDFKGLPRQSAGRCRTDYDVLQEAV